MEVHFAITSSIYNIIFLQNFLGLTLTILAFIALGILIASLIIFKAFRTKSQEIKALKNECSNLKDKIKDYELSLNRFTASQNLIINDLHDNFGNRLASVHNLTDILLDNIKNPESDDFIKTSELLLQTTSKLSEEIRDFSWSSNHDNDRLEHVIIRLNLFITEFNKQQNEVTVIFNTKKDRNYMIPFLWNRQILQILKQAIRNSYIHSKSSKIEIDIEALNNFLTINFRDYGIVIDENNAERNSNLEKIKTMASSIGLELTIESKPGRGTQITLKGKIGFR